MFSIEELQPLIKESETFSSHPSNYSFKDAKGNPVHLISWTHLANDFIGVLPRLKKIVIIPEQIWDKEVSHWHSKISFKNLGSKSGWDWYQDFGQWYREGCLSPDFFQSG